MSTTPITTTFASADVLRLGATQRFELRPAQRALWVDGQATDLGARAFDVLLVLVELRQRMVSKQELLDRVWPGLVVEENNVAVQISSLRRVLGGDVIATVPGRGYRFTAPVQVVSDAALVDGLTAPSTVTTTATPALRPSPAPRPAPPAEAQAMDAANTGGAASKTNLPRVLPALRGRVDDLAALGALVAQHSLVSVVGAGGMGKSLLTQHLLYERRDSYAHGVCWVEMAAVTDPITLPGVIAAALGVRPGVGEPLAALAAALAPLQTLVALDNAEHLLADVAHVADALLEAAPGLRLVVTSQAPLKLARELVYRIGPLSVPQGPLPADQALGFGAVALFVDRARAADSRFVLTDAGAPAVIELCRSLDGLALAIELAAARAPVLGVQRLAASMQDRLKLLTSSHNRIAPARQQTLRATLEWSHGLLAERERVVFRRMGVMAHSASLSFVQQVVADSPDNTLAPGSPSLDRWAVLDALAELVDRSLVAVVNDDQDHGAATWASEDSEPRYRLLDTPRLFALDRLSDAGEAPELRHRHAAAMTALFEQALSHARDGSIGTRAWATKLAPDFDNAREAMAWSRATGEKTRVLQIGATLMLALPGALQSESKALFNLLEGLVDSRVEAQQPLRLQAHVWGQMAANSAHGERRRSFAAAQKAVTAARALQAQESDPQLLYWALCVGVTQARRVNDMDYASAALAEAQALQSSRWPPHLLHFGALAETSMVSAQGDAAEYLRLCRRNLDIEHARGDDGSIAMGNLVDAELAVGDAAAAARTGSALLAQLARKRDERSLAYVRLNTLAAWLALGDLAQARPLAEAGWPQATMFDMQPYWGDYLSLLAALEQRPKAAALLAGYASATYAARQETRQRNEAAALERALQLTHPLLSTEACEALQRHGSALRDQDIGAIALALNDITDV